MIKTLMGWCVFVLDPRWVKKKKYIIDIIFSGIFSSEYSEADRVQMFAGRKVYGNTT